MQNINRAIKRATEGNVGDFAESTFEAYGFGGASLIINVLSDNANRANADVKSTVNKRNGKIAESGSVLFMYDRKGKVEVGAVLDEEELLDAAIEAGIDDFLLEEVRTIELTIDGKWNMRYELTILLLTKSRVMTKVLPLYM
jgi:transcriptional/translational regulatory protein YebC/TACO1